MLPQQMHTTFGSKRDLEKEKNPKIGRKPPPHLRDHVWESIDGWVDAEAQATKNRTTAQKFIDDGVPQIFPANQKRRGISAAVRGGCSGNANEPFNHVPGEDPSKWEKAHHFKRFASRPEMIHDSVWACTGYAKDGLPDALAKLLPSHSSVRNSLKSAARDQLVADGAMPPALPRYRKLWAFQKREMSLSKKLTVPPRPPQSLEEKYPDYEIIRNPESAAFKAKKNSTYGLVAASGEGGDDENHYYYPRDSCVAGCCTTCGTNLKPWKNGLPQNIYNHNSNNNARARSTTPHQQQSRQPHLSQYATEKREQLQQQILAANSANPHHHVITLPRSNFAAKADFGSPKKWQTTNGRVFNTRAASAGNIRKRAVNAAAAH